MAWTLGRPVLPEQRAWAEQRSRQEQRWPRVWAAEQQRQEHPGLQARRQPVFQRLRSALPRRVASRMEWNWPEQERLAPPPACFRFPAAVEQATWYPRPS